MLFRSKHPDINWPRDVTIWHWLFESKDSSPIYNNPPNKVAGYTNAITKERLSWAQAKEWAEYISTALVNKYGLRESETVSLFSQNTIWYPVTMFAAIRIGAKVSGASPAYNVEEMTHALKVADAKFIFTQPKSMPVAIAAAKNVGIPEKHIFLLEGESKGFVTVQQLIAIGKGCDQQVPAFQIPKGKTNHQICGFLNFSSGTTGLPKAVMLSHQNLIAQALQLKQVAPDPPRTYLAVLPIYHITGLVRFCCTPVFCNDEVVMLPSFTMKAMLDAVVEFRLRDLTLVPPLVIRLVHDPLVSQYDLSTLCRISSGSAPTSPEIIQQLAKKFPRCGFRQGYGMTESTACITCHPPEYYDYKYAHTGGTVVASTVVKVVDPDTGKELGYNEEGEIWARGPQIAMGYLGNPTATTEAFDKDGFLHTGDIGALDEEGLIHITDRIKEMIKVKGIAVAPAELEDLLLGHPDVEDCAVVSVRDDYSGERPKAFVTVKKPVQPSKEVAKKLMDHVRDRKVRFKWIHEIEFIDLVPKSPSGKILRRVLKQREKDGVFGFVVKDDRPRARL